MKITYKQLLDLDSMVGGLYQKDPSLRESKFGYAYNRFIEKDLKTIFNDYSEELLMIRIDNAQVNETTKALITNPSNFRGFDYSKEGLKAVIKSERELQKAWETKEFEIEPYFIKPENLPEGLIDEQLDLMRGIIIE